MTYCTNPLWELHSKDVHSAIGQTPNEARKENMNLYKEKNKFKSN
jgi:hypothetical protein